MASTHIYTRCNKSNEIEQLQPNQFIANNQYPPKKNCKFFTKILPRLTRSHRDCRDCQDLTFLNLDEMVERFPTSHRDCRDLTMMSVSDNFVFAHG